MESELESGSQSKQDYLPEYMLVYKLIQEVHLQTSSQWYPWLQSLPTQFSTGLFLDDVERNHVERMTGEYMKVQSVQFQACLDLFQKLLSSQASRGSKGIIPVKFLDWMSALQQDIDNEDSRFDELVKWAFTIVFTRSWRSPDRQHAQIVPLGDLANHDSQFANLKPGFRQTDGAFQFFVTGDIDVVGPTNSKLYLSYGLTYAPARYLVLFGFCDVTAAYIDARLNFVEDNDDDKWPTILEPSQLVASTSNGALSEEVWIAFLLKVLQKEEPKTLVRIRNAFDVSDESGEEIVEKTLETWELKVGTEIQAYYQRMLSTDFMPITATEKDLAEHPNLSMIVNYNLFVRETYLKVLDHVDTFLTQCSQFQQLSASKGENITASRKLQEIAILNSTVDSSEGSNRTSLSPKSDSTNEKSEPKLSQSESTRQVSPEPIEKDSTGMEQDNTLPSKPLPKLENASAQPVRENIPSNTASSSFNEKFDQQSFAVPDSQEVIDANSKPEWNDSITGRESFTGEISQGEANLNTTSRFSSENFSLQSYSNASPNSYGGNSDAGYNSSDQTAPNGSDEPRSSNIPTGEFNPEYYTSSQMRPTQDSVDLEATTPTTIPFYGTSGSQSYFTNATPELPGGNWDLFEYSNSSAQFDSNGGPTTPTTTQQWMDSTAAPTLINENSTPNPYYGNGSVQFDYGGEAATTPSGEGIDSAVTPGFPNDSNTDDSQSYFVDEAEPSQDGIDDLATSYAQSLVSDQRGHSSLEQQQQQPQQSDGGAASNETNNRDVPSGPTTYAEYVQQRDQEDPIFTSDQDAVFASDQDPIFAPDPSGFDNAATEPGANDDESIRYGDNDSFDEYNGF
jgi:hypothetical protein